MQKTIVLVDDEQDLLRLVSLRLEKNGYRVLCAGDGNEALTLIRSRRPDLVLLDYLLPGLSGDEVCRRLRNDPQTARLPVIMFSASCSDSACSQLRHVGADDLLVKPFDSTELLKKINRLLEQ